MAIADVQARSLLTQVLRQTAAMVESQVDVPFERATNGVFAILDKGRKFTDASTGQSLYTLVYGMVSEAKEDIEALTARLIAPSDE